MSHDNLARLGWGPDFERFYSEHKTEDSHPARVISVSRGTWLLAGVQGERFGVPAGKFHYHDIEMPVVGDWIVARGTGDDSWLVIQDVLPRRNHLSRKAPGKTSARQVMAANIDIMFVVQDALALNCALAERYLVLAKGSDITPVLVLNKCDTEAHAAEALGAIAERIPGVTAVAASALTGLGIGDIRAHVAQGVTACLLGPSGAGKSSIINGMLGTQRQPIGEIREGDRKGRHTTTVRELFFLSGGGMVIDTPGMRELMPWDASGLDDSYRDIEELAAQCRFDDCAHETEPGCAVRQAVESGTLDPGRLENFHRLTRELAYLESQIDENARREKKRKEKELHRLIKDYNRNRRKP